LLPTITTATSERFTGPREKDRAYRSRAVMFTRPWPTPRFLQGCVQRARTDDRHTWTWARSRARTATGVRWS